MEQKFTEFSEFKESDKSLKHEFSCGSILVSNTRGDWVAGSSLFTVMTNIFVTP